MEESILVSIKKLLGIDSEYTHFDTDIIMHINSVLSVLTQLGVGPSEGFVIEDSNALWTDFLSSARDIEMVKAYIYLKVRLLFDPPTSSAAMESAKQLISELEWRINVAVDSGQVT